MTRQDAAKVVQAFFEAHGQKSQGLNDKGLGGILFGIPSGAAQVFFEYDAGAGQLLCRAHILTYRPQDSVEEDLKAFRAEEQAGTPTGGGKLEYVPQSRALFLKRTYSTAAAPEAFIAEVNELAASSLKWGREVFDRVMDKLQASKGQERR